MRNNWRTFLAVIVVAFLLVPTISAPLAFAGESSSSEASGTLAMPVVTLEKAIQIIKTNFDVPKDYTDFSSSYNTSDDRQVWALRWNGNEEQPGEFAAEVSTINGDILSVNYWKNDKQSGNSPSTPTISKSGAQEISDNLLKRLLGKRTEELSLNPSEFETTPLSYGPFNYSFDYQRHINGVPFLGNGVNVQVSSTDGHITSYYLNWNNVKAPEVKGAINADQALQAFAAAPFFKLKYWIPASYRPLIVGQKQEAKLVYQLDGENGGAIDALTGLPLQLKQGDWLATDSLGFGGMGNQKLERTGLASNGIQLTPQEQQEVERTAKLLKQDEAITEVKRWIEIPDNLTLRSASLIKDWRSADKRIWSFEWNIITPDKKEGIPQYLSARVSASTGELLGFDIANQQTGKTEVKLDRKAAQNLAEKFLKRVQGDRFSQVVIDPDNNNNGKMILEPEPWNIQGFSYHRVVNGIDFPENGMTVNVDPVTGKITSFQLNWFEYDLPSVSGILSKEIAVESFLKARPLTLTYVRIYSNGIPGDLRLVYLPIVQDRSIPISNIIDAKSGELLNYEGQPVEKGPKPFVFTDLSEVNGAPEIAALGQAGLFGDYGNSFKPIEKISVVSMLRAMYLSRFGLWGNTGLTEEEVINKAKELGWLKEDLKPGDPVNRELLAKVLLRYIQLNKIAELKDIYQVSFQDFDQISSDALGYVAIASSTGIIKVEGKVLGPRETVNRAEAATALFRALGWRN